MLEKLNYLAGSNIKPTFSFMECATIYRNMKFVGGDFGQIY